MARAWLASHRWMSNTVNLRESGKAIVFEDVDLPEVTDEKFVIPWRMKWAIALAIPMDLDSLTHAPTAVGDAATGLGYSQSAFVVASARRVHSGVWAIRLFRA